MVACKGYAAGEGRGSNPLAFGIAIARSVSASAANSLMFGGTIFSLSSGYFSGKNALSRERCATSMAEWVLILRWRSLPMHKTNSIIMCAPRMTIFETAANLELWPRILPHYRYIRYLEHGPSRNVVVMAATRSGIPISWTSEQIIDRDRMEVRFYHMKAFTKGMRVVWTFQEVPDGVLVEIKHDLAFRVKILAPIADKIIGDFFIHHIANKTLRCMKSYVETSTNKVIA